MKNIYTRFSTLVAIVLISASVAVNADVTIKILKGGAAPYVYAFDDNKSPIGDSWPGTQLTEKDSNGYWQITYSGRSQVNLVFNNGSSGSGNQTNDILMVKGVDGVARFVYNGGSIWFGEIPPLNTTSEGYIYFNCPPQYTGTPTAYLWNGSSTNGWPGKEMEYVGLDGAGFKIYRYNTSSLSFTPSNVIFLGNVWIDGVKYQTSDLTYVANGYYNTEGSQALVHALTSANGYTDNNFRAGIAAQLGINDGDVFLPGTVTYLDVSNRNISYLSGISNFTNLQTLIAANNNLQTVDLGNNATVEVLNLSGNSVLLGFTSSYNNTTGYINLATNNNSLKELYLDNCNIGYLKAINSKYGVSSLERLSIANDTRMKGWSEGGINSQTNLKYLNVTNIGVEADGVKLTGLAKLDTLIADNNTNLGNISTLSSATNLRYVSLRNCGLTNSISFLNNSALEYIDISNNSTNAKNFKLSANQNLKVFKASKAGIKQNGLTWDKTSANLDTLIVSGNSAMQYLATINYATNLRYLDMSSGDLYLKNMPNFTGANMTALEYLDISSDLISAENTLSDFAALKTLKVKSNSSMPSIVISNCRALETIDLTGNVKQTELALNNQGYTSGSMLPAITASGCTALTTLNLNNNSFATITSDIDPGFEFSTLKINSNALTDISGANNYSTLKYLYAQDNNFGANYELKGNTNLTGLAISNSATNTAMTTFTGENNTALTALDLSGNSSLTTLNLHGNTALTQTTATAGAIESPGLYVKGLASLETMDISNSSFTTIGHNKSLLGTGLKTLKASHNNFTTFTNSNYNLDVSGNENYRPASYVSGKSSLEDLTALEWLDISYNQIADSVHLKRNTALKHLDVSHNQVLGDLASTDEEKEEMIKKKVMAIVKYSNINPVTNKSKTIGISMSYSTSLRDARKVTDYEGLARYYDLRPCDLRDTTGIYHLDLHYCPNLEYLDFSYTNIHNTAAGHVYMNTGWDRTGNWDDYVTSGTTSAKNGPTKHHFIWFQPCSKLKVIKADHNNMQSMGLSCYPELDTISCVGMYGDSYFMRDFKEPGWGNKIFTADMKKYKSSTVTTKNGEPVETVNYETTTYPNAIRYIDFSEGGFYMFNTENCPALTTLTLNDNNLQGGYYNDTPLDVTVNPLIEHLNVQNNSTLKQIDAYGLNALQSINLTGSSSLEVIKAYDDPVLYDGADDFITGLDGCTSLKELWVSNDNITQMPDISGLSALETLKVQDNAALDELTVDSNTALKHLDAARCSLDELDLSNNTALQYLDISNTDVPSSMSENGKNKLSDLVINSSAITTVKASNNNLYSIKGVANRTNLTTIEFANNHINGIDLSGCTSLSAEGISDEGNSRNIEAEYNVVSITDSDGQVHSYDVYFFYPDTDAATAAGHTALGNRTSTDELKGEARDALSEEGFDITKVTAWDSNATLFHGTKGANNARRKANSTFDPANADDVLNASSVTGDIVLLDANNPTASYSYDNGVTTSSFSFGWTAPSVPTAVTEVFSEEFTATGAVGKIVITTPQDVEVNIVDLSGRVILTQEFAAGSHSIDMPAGIYIVNSIKVVVQ